ncbi:MAG: RNA 2',3'-cyclic phosphodiesterase [Desulfobacterales bacterium]
MPNAIRTFVAIEIPENITSSLHELQQGLKDYGIIIRWIHPENIHLTLKFLGDVEAADIDDISGAISNAADGVSPISLKPKGIGIFPGIKRPRVLWVGLTGQLEFLIRLQKSLDENLRNIGFPQEKRPFKGHLTIGRIKAKMDIKKLGDALIAFRNFESETFIADKIILFKSELKPQGAVYTSLASVSLA